MKTFQTTLLMAFVGLLVTAVATEAQDSRHDAVADDGTWSFSGSAESFDGVDADWYPGDATVTRGRLWSEGVDLIDEDEEEFARLSALADPRGTSQELVIDWDTRERLRPRTYPSRAKVLITFSEGRCSGTLIGPHTVVTAGHCVHEGDGGSFYSRSSYTIFPGRDGSTSPYGSCTAASLHTVRGWSRAGNEKYDYGAIKLDCTVGNTVGWFGFSKRDPDDTPSIIGGYPGDKPLQQWQSSDMVAKTSTRQCFYRNDTTTGMSGSGVWSDNNGPYLRCIHTNGLHGIGAHSSYNHGVRIIKAVYNNFLTWKQ